MYNRYKQDTMIFWKGSIQKDRSARFTGKLYDEELQMYVFPYRNYDASTPAGAPPTPQVILMVSTSTSMQGLLR